MTTIEKNKQYMLQFPEDVPVEKQAEYLKKLDDKLKTDRFVVVDPKIKVFATKESNEVKENDKKTENNSGQTNEKGDSSTPGTDSGTGNGTSEETKQTESGTENKEESTTKDDKNQTKSDTGESKVTIEKVEAQVPAKAEEPKNILDVAGTSDEQ